MPSLFHLQMKISPQRIWGKGQVQVNLYLMFLMFQTRLGYVNRVTIGPLLRIQLNTKLQSRETLSPKSSFGSSKHGVEIEGYLCKVAQILQTKSQILCSYT